MPPSPLFCSTMFHGSIEFHSDVPPHPRVSSPSEKSKLFLDRCSEDGQKNRPPSRIWHPSIHPFLPLHFPFPRPCILSLSPSVSRAIRPQALQSNLEPDRSRIHLKLPQTGICNFPLGIEWRKMYCLGNEKLDAAFKEVLFSVSRPDIFPRNAEVIFAVNKPEPGIPRYVQPIGTERGRERNAEQNTKAREKREGTVWTGTSSGTNMNKHAAAMGTIGTASVPFRFSS